MENVFKNAVNSGHGTALLYATLLGLIVSDALPTPADSLFFWDEQRLKRKLELREITPKQFWTKNALGYYFYNIGWWSLVGAVVIGVKGDFYMKARLSFALISAGAVFSILNKNVKKDNQILALQDARVSPPVTCPEISSYTQP